MVLLRATRIALRPLIPLIPLIIVSLGMTSIACKEEQGGIEVKDLSFSGNTAVSSKQLQSVISTTESPRVPWGPREVLQP